MANPAQFGQPTVPVTINLPAGQLPQVAPPAAPAPAQQQQVQPPQSKQSKIPAARYYLFPWKQ